MIIIITVKFIFTKMSVRQLTRLFNNHSLTLDTFPLSTAQHDTDALCTFWENIKFQRYSYKIEDMETLPSIDFTSHLLIECPPMNTYLVYL